MRSEARRGESSASRFPETLERLPGLSLVETTLKAALHSDAPLLCDIPSYLYAMGGKRIRPALCLLSAHAQGLRETSPALANIAAGIELIHMATLLHDDIIDNSPFRRHHPSPLARYGMPNTLLAGDFLYVRAFGLCSKLDRFTIEETEKACVELTEGEILETSLYTQEHSVDSALTICCKKTAALFRLAALTGTHLAGAGESAVQRMGYFGENLGIAFQILDDILDVISTKEELGKEPGIDLRERKPSVVNVLWLRSGDPLARRLTAQPNSEDDMIFVEEALACLRRSPIIAEARGLAQEYVARAREHLLTARQGAPEAGSEYAAVLEALLDYSLQRVM